MKYDYTTAEKTIKELRTLYPKYLEATAKSSCDKYGFEWNEDNRFSIFSCNVSLNTHTGYYGSSSCSTFGSVGNNDLFSTYFIKWLMNNTPRMLLEIADAIEKDAQGAKEKRITELQAELNRLQETPAQ